MLAIARLKRVAVASTAKAAVLAARNFEGVTIVEPGTLDSLPIDVLPPDPEGVQYDLFVPASPEPEKLELMLGKI